MATTAPQRKKAKVRVNLQTHDIDLDKPHLKREAKVNEIIQIAEKKKRVVLGGPPATGKSALLTLLTQTVEARGDTVWRKELLKGEDPQELMKTLRSMGVVNDRDVMKRSFSGRKLWLFIDEGQNGYDIPGVGDFWVLLFKFLPQYRIERGGVYVVVASTYDSTVSDSPVFLQNSPHILPHMSEEEAVALYKVQTETWNNWRTWDSFLGDLLDLGRLVDVGDDDDDDLEDPEEAKIEHVLYHVGVVTCGAWLLSPNVKRGTLTEAEARKQLRTSNFIQQLDRCFKTGTPLPAGIEPAMAKQLTQVEIPETKSVVKVTAADSVFPAVQRGLLNKYGGFSCLAAKWYYNFCFFPGRATVRPASLDEFVVDAVRKLSGHALQHARDNGRFPKEAVFQQMLNGTMNMLLPASNFLIPELNTKAVVDGRTVTGELDFYVDGMLKWAIELLREGDTIAKHLGRFHRETGKYKEVDTNDYLVVDLRGPKIGRGVEKKPNRCTFYFSEDFSECTCQRRLEEAFKVIISQ